MRILIVKLGSIGDVIHTLPALAAIRQFRTGEISGRTISLNLRDNPLLDHLIEVDTKARGGRCLETLRAPRQQLRRLRAWPSMPQ
jgi:ADP-heptose:LPS heptosyltransferase